jgi:hypothetical protein
MSVLDYLSLIFFVFMGGFVSGMTIMHKITRGRWLP